MERPGCGQTTWEVSGLPNLLPEGQVDSGGNYYSTITNRHCAIKIGSLWFVIASRERGDLCVTYGFGCYRKVMRVSPLPLESGQKGMVTSRNFTFSL